MSLTPTFRALVDELTEVFQENRRLREENERLKASFKVPTNKKKLTNREVAEIRRLARTTGMSQREVAEIYDVNPATVCRILKGVYHK
ncbi:helix-turn-helix domain-containing protein [Mycobacterium intracellulare]|uniref:Helix-turn-helix domain-containing protein n=1 Tax=Mycobacterium intracellulare TaxID=1767 RepID=A0AAE4RD43_MYCIT|nr:helix-turn-helix domain-containing protein [Mycobacterium intracellulare]MDV6975283.1 helix-turn-helix domain-containing protein [Mycobacterium intracellulare]MDV6980347.1 helix-turn-helix domain-containing protein [Mycobacterium intracellulare]MDV7010776.1 helix-turn-helix domain-containing protein [Mycobacterium intracellulare]MDV7025682.1 helix-turn-helix domain-containing protein [Mycobacterium intracellulare]